MMRICPLPTSRCRRLSALFLLGNQRISTSIAAVTGCMSSSQRMRASRAWAKRLLETEPLLTEAESMLVECAIGDHGRGARTWPNGRKRRDPFRGKVATHEQEV